MNMMNIFNKKENNIPTLDNFMRIKYSESFPSDISKGLSLNKAAKYLKVSAASVHLHLYQLIKSGIVNEGNIRPAGQLYFTIDWPTFYQLEQSFIRSLERRRTVAMQNLSKINARKKVPITHEQALQRLKMIELNQPLSSLETNK